MICMSVRTYDPNDFIFSNQKHSFRGFSATGHCCVAFVVTLARMIVVSVSTPFS